LGSPNRGGKKNKAANTTAFSNRLRNFHADFSEIFLKAQNTRAKKKESKPMSEEKLIKKVCLKIEEGGIRNAMRLLTSNDILASDCDETVKMLQEKHPKAPCDRRSPPGTLLESITVSPDTVFDILERFPKASSGGLDRLSPQHLKDMFLNVVENSVKGENKDILTDFVNFILAGNTPYFIRPVFFGARLVALKKPDGGIRPIAIGNSLRRLCAKLVNSWATKKLKDTFPPFNLVPVQKMEPKRLFTGSGHFSIGTHSLRS
jgi:hypothetical protein